jgi:hypothetical protein
LRVLEIELPLCTGCTERSKIEGRLERENMVEGCYREKLSITGGQTPAFQRHIKRMGKWGTQQGMLENPKGS